MVCADGQAGCRGDERRAQRHRGQPQVVLGVRALSVLTGQRVWGVLGGFTAEEAALSRASGGPGWGTAPPKPTRDRIVLKPLGFAPHLFFHITFRGDLGFLCGNLTYA